jgi:predicted secreted hydrolase
MNKQQESRIKVIPIPTPDFSLGALRGRKRRDYNLLSFPLFYSVGEEPAGDGEQKRVKDRPGFLAFIFCFLMSPVFIEASETLPSYTFKQALPGYVYSFPKDHGSHNDFKTEWWYYTGHLTTEKGDEYGYQVTFFRIGSENAQVQASPSRWAAKHLYFAHFAISDISRRQFFFTEKLNRAALGKAGAEEGKYLVWNEDWMVREEENGIHHLRASQDKFAIDLILTPLKGPVIHGENGISQKAEGVGHASHYVSFTRLKTEGTLFVEHQPMKVTGISWMDHEFGSNQLQDYQVGWDWFSIQLNNQTELMFYHLRQRNGNPDPYSSGTLVFSDGTWRHLKLEEIQIEVLKFWQSPFSGGNYPIQWRVHIPGYGITLELVPAFENQELRPGKTGVIYWEGSVNVTGSYGNQKVTGKGYVEMTGYAGKFDQKI